MMRVFITGSADGLGLLAGQMLAKQGHQVTLHARSEQRANDAKAALPQAEGCLVGDLASIEETKKLADEINKLPRFDAIIHNAGIGPGVSSANFSPEGYAATFAINSLAPYILTCLVQRPSRLVYMSSGMHRTGNTDMSIDALTWKSKQWRSSQAYCDSKLQNVLFANIVAKHWSGQVLSNSVDPGWQPTKMGGRGAPGELAMGAETQAWLATSDDNEAKVTGKYWNYKQTQTPRPETEDENVQAAYLKACEQLSGGIKLPD